MGVGAKPSATVHNLLVSEKIIDAPKINKFKKSKKAVAPATPVVAGVAPAPVVKSSVSETPKDESKAEEKPADLPAQAGVPVPETPKA